MFDAVRVVRSGGGVLLALDGDRERHVADVLGVVACGLDLGDRPGAEHHGGDVAAVQLVLGSFPIGGGVIVLGQAIGHGVIQDLVDVVGVGAVTRILERVLGVGEDVVHVVGIAAGRAADVRVPGAHGPTSRVVGVQRSGLGLLLDGARHIDRVLGRGQTACGADFAVNAGHQAGIHGHDAFARQRGTTASIEFGSILHDTNGRADGIFGRSALFQQRIAGFKGPVQILLHLGATFRRVLLAAIASACVDHQKDSIRISWQPGPFDCGNAASFVDIFYSFRYLAYV